LLFKIVIEPILADFNTKQNEKSKNELLEFAVFWWGGCIVGKKWEFNKQKSRFLSWISML